MVSCAFAEIYYHIPVISDKALYTTMEHNEKQEWEGMKDILYRL